MKIKKTWCYAQGHLALLALIGCLGDLLFLPGGVAAYVAPPLALTTTGFREGDESVPLHILCT